MKGQCDDCKEVYNITYSPNNIEGYFITQELWDSIGTSEYDELIKNKQNKIYCQKCPKCGNITRINYG